MADWKTKIYEKGENEVNCTVFSCHFMVKKQVRDVGLHNMCHGTCLKGKDEVDIDAVILERR